jgi:uncharacterized protein (DUF433 family)
MIRPAETSLGKSARVYLDEGVYVDPEFVADFTSHNSGMVVYYAAMSFSEKLTGQGFFHAGDVGMTTELFRYQSTESEARSFNRALAERLCEEHSEISTYPGIFGGAPHIKGVRLSVGNVLSELYLQGSINAVATTFSVGETQIKEAIAYAQDFLESAISPRSEIDG